MRSDTQPSNIPWRLTTHTHTHLSVRLQLMDASAVVFTHIVFKDMCLQLFFSWTFSSFRVMCGPSVFSDWSQLSFHCCISLFVTIAFKWFRASLFFLLLMARCLVGIAMIVLFVCAVTRLSSATWNTNTSISDKNKRQRCQESAAKMKFKNSKSRLRTTRWQRRIGRLEESLVFFWLTFDYWRSLLNQCHPNLSN